MPYQDCQNVPQQQCRAVHKKVPQRISRTVPKKVCDGGSGGSEFNKGSSGSSFGFPRGSGSSGNRGPGLRNVEEDVELIPEKQVKATPKTKDAVNFGKLSSSIQGPNRSHSFQSIPSQTQSTWTWS